MKVSTIVPLINEEKMTIAQIAKHLNKSEATIWRWVKLLREHGFELKTQKKGAKPLEI